MKPSIAVLFYSDTCITALYFSFYLSEKFIPNTNCDIRSPKENGAMCEHKDERMKGHWCVTTLFCTTHSWALQWHSCLKTQQALEIMYHSFCFKFLLSEVCKFWQMDYYGWVKWHLLKHSSGYAIELVITWALKIHLQQKKRYCFRILWFNRLPICL